MKEQEAGDSQFKELQDIETRVDKLEELAGLIKAEIKLKAHAEIHTIEQQQLEINEKLAMLKKFTAGSGLNLLNDVRQAVEEFDRKLQGLNDFYRNDADEKTAFDALAE